MRWIYFTACSSVILILIPLHAWAELSARATPELGTCLARQLHAEIDRLHECMSDSANLSGAAVYPDGPGTRRGTVQPLGMPEC